MANSKKRTTMQRVYKEDNKKWKEWCKNLDVSSAELFNKMIRSRNMDTERRMLKEIEFKKMKMRRKYGFN
jgi:L-2-hydroxyglutarate oxidase LhgO